MSALSSLGSRMNASAMRRPSHGTRHGLGHPGRHDRACLDESFEFSSGQLLTDMLDRFRCNALLPYVPEGRERITGRTASERELARARVLQANLHGTDPEPPVRPGRRE